MHPAYARPQLKTLQARLNEPPRFMTVVAGPRQTGKSTLVRQALSGRAATFVATDQPVAQTPDALYAPASSIQLDIRVKPSAKWIVDQWTQARARARVMPRGRSYVLAIDEIQKIPRWSETVKGLWDADRAEGLALHIVLLGSSPWIMQQGLTESLAGRYEVIALTHWSFGEMREAFGVSIDEYVYFGGYPGAAPLIQDVPRWRRYVRDSLIRTNLDTDILQMTRVDKPILLKQLFELGCGSYSGQIVSFTRLLGQLQDAGNTVTLAHYLNLLAKAGLLTGLQKYAAQAHRKRASPPKFNVHNTALISAQAAYSFDEARADRSYWGRLVESAVGAHLINHRPDHAEIFYWRESPHEVDFILSGPQTLSAIEVKSASAFKAPPGLHVFAEKFRQVRPLVVGDGGVPLDEFLLAPVEHWLA